MGARRHPHKRGVLGGGADAPSSVQGQSPVGAPGGKAPRSKMNLTFDTAKN